VLLAASRAQADNPEGSEGADNEPAVVAVIPFGAPTPAQAGAMTAACEAALRRVAGIQVLPGAAWEKEAKESGAGDDLEAMARRLGADAVVTGALSRDGAGWRLSVDVFDERGQPVESSSLELLVPEIGPAAAFRLEDLLNRVLRRHLGIQDPAPGPVGPEPSPQDTDRERPVQLAPAVEPLRPEAPQPAAPARPPWRPVLVGSLGLGVTGRTLTCGATDLARRNQPCDGAQYPLDAGAGLRLQADFYSFELGWRMAPALRGLGVGFLLEVPFWRDREQAGVSGGLRVTQVRFEGGLRGRWPLGEGLRRPVLEAGLLYGYHSFVIAGSTTTFPDVQYQYLMPSLGMGGFAAPRLYLHGGVSLLGVVSAGEAGAPTDGLNLNPFGSGKVLGFRLGLEASYQVYKGLAVVVGGSLERVSFLLDGQGCTMRSIKQSGCDEPGTGAEPVREVADLYPAGWVSLGYWY
jgi:hypothetical protein